MSVLGVSFLVLIFFIYTIFCSIVFLVFNKKKEERLENKISILSDSYGKDILNQLEKIKNKEEVSLNEIQKVKLQLKDNIHEEVFNRTIILFNKDSSNNKYNREYIYYYEDYIRNIISSDNKQDKGAYIAFLLGEYKLDIDFVNEYLIECLGSNSSYVRFNAFRSLSKIGNVKFFIKALEVISNNNNNLNDKIIIDIIDEFGGDLDLLYKEVLEVINTLSNKSKYIFINYCINKKNHVLSDTLLNMLNDASINNEVRAAIIKYFGVNKYDECKSYLLDSLESGSRECRALSAKSLASYGGKDTIEKLLVSIKDNDWYVRLNSAITLLELGISNEQVLSIINGDDKYAKDILNYALTLKIN